MTRQQRLSVAGQMVRSSRHLETNRALAGRDRLVALVEGEIARRAGRVEFLPASLFADPAWDMLLDLYRAHLLQHRRSVTNLCAASLAPPSTALRWIAVLESHGLIVRRGDALDHRRVHIELTQASLGAMASYFFGRSFN